ncbi:MAG: hypothetical protein U0903_18180 [Planctomycetales bacterium]
MRIPGSAEQSLNEVLQEWQRRDFEALDASWKGLAEDVKNSTPHPRPLSHKGRGEEILWRAYLERPRGHSKTSDLAVQLVWILLFARRRIEGLAAAADRDQGDLIRDAIQRLVDLNPELCRKLRFRNHEVFNSETGSKLR